MMPRHFPILTLLGAVLILLLVAAATSTAGTLRIKLTDGNSLEVPYCWEEGGLIKFEIPGGTVGIPKSQVASIEEVIASKPFSPDTMSQREEVYLKVDEEEQQWLKEFIAKQTPKSDEFVAMNSDQVDQLLDQRDSLKLVQQAKPVRIYSSTLDRTGEIAEWVRLKNGRVMLLINNAVSTSKDLAGQRIYLTLFDGQGRRVKQVQCQVHPLKANRTKMKQLGISGRLYALVATVEPDSRIKRYEITTSRY